MTYSGGTSKGWFTNIIDNEDGSYAVDFVGKTAGTSVDIEVKIGGETIPKTKPQIAVTYPRLEFTGNSSPASPATSRVFSELDGGFTVTGNCDVELGDVTISGDILADGTLTTICNSAGGGTFSIFLNHAATKPYVYSWTGSGVLASISAAQSTMKEIDTTIFKINSANPPITISNLADLQSITCGDSSVFYILANDIDVAAESGSSTNNWTPLCDSPSFQGGFEGNNFTISNIHINTGNFGRGFFAQTWQSSISNLNIQNITVIGGSMYAGGLIGSAGNTDVIRNIHLAGSDISGSGFAVGGLISYGNVSKIFNSSFSGVVSGGSRVAGILGWGSSNEIRGCQVFGNVTGGNDYIGAIKGYGSTGIIANSSSTAVVIGYNYVGGLTGNGSNIYSSYFTGSVSGNSYVGGLAGSAWSLPNTSYFAGSINVGTSNGGPLAGEYTGFSPSENDKNYYLDSASCTGCDLYLPYAARTDTELKTQSTFDWDFYKIFKIDEGISMPTHQ